MFNWVVKVVPQPPDAAGTEETAKIPDAPPKITEAPVKPLPPKNTEEVSEDGHAQTGVLGWLSNGFVSALPQPSGSPRLSRANSDAKSGEDGDRSGVMNWVTHGLTKVLPQPDEKYRETQKDTKDEEHTEVYDVATMPDFDPLPHIPVVEMVSDEEMSEIESMTTHFPSKVVTWIKQRVPQPVPPGAVPVDPPTKSSRSSLDKILSPPPESLSGISLDTDSKASGVVNWFVSGLGLKLPQPVTPSKDEANSASEVIQKVNEEVFWSDGRSLTQSLFSFCFRGEGAASPLNSRRRRLGDAPTPTDKHTDRLIVLPADYRDYRQL